MVKRGWHEFEDPSIQVRTAPNPNLDIQSNSQVCVELIKAGKKGKKVTLIRGLVLEVEETKTLLKKLKTYCGSGGTFKQGCIELQGDHVKTALEYLEGKGYKQKHSSR